MKNHVRVLSFLLACIMLFTSVKINTYAGDMEDTVSGNGLEAIEEYVLENEFEDAEESDLEEQDNNIALVDSVPEITVSNNEMEMIKNAVPEPGQGEENLPIEEATSQVQERNDFLGFEVDRVELSEVQGEIYDAEELIQIAEETALFSQSYGEYWDSYTSYYIYNQLSKDERKLWRAMEILYNGYLEDEIDLYDGSTDYVTIQSTEVKESDLYGLAVMFKYTHPQYYFLMSGFNSLTNGYNSSVGIAFNVYDSFLDGTYRKNETAEIQKVIDECMAMVEAKNTEEEKVQAIHDWICDKVDYNDYAYEMEISPVEETEYTQTAYSVMRMDRTVCAGYALAFMWLCNAADVEGFAVTGTGHAFNKVKVNDSWYNLDCTWNDGYGVGNREYWQYLRDEEPYFNDSAHTEHDFWVTYLPECTLDSNSGYSPGQLPVITERTETPVISVETGEKGHTITITSATEGAKIYYTLDGMAPTESATRGYLYTEPFTINDQVTIKAVAVCDQKWDSDIVEKEIELIEYNQAEGIYGDLNWYIDALGCLHITGNGDMPNGSGYSKAPWYAYKEQIQSIDMAETITSVGDYAFFELENVVSCTIPETITSIGNYAFSESGLGEVVIPQNVNSIGEYAFYNTYDLKTVEIKGNIENFGKNIFYNCQNIIEVILPDELEKLGAGMFMYCTELKKIELPRNLMQIGSSAFEYCYYLREVSLPEELQTISERAFASCIKLQQIYIPKSVTSIGTNALDTTTELIGYLDSTAHTYAQENGNKFTDVYTFAYKIEFITGTEEEIAPQYCLEGEVVIEPLMLTNPGYIFKGWYTSADVQDETTEWNFENTVIGAMKLYARWERDSYRLEGFQQTGESLVYTGKEIIQQLSIYHGEKLLRKDRDYTLKYRNNIDAASYDDKKAPSVTITMKGQYSGKRTLYYTILPRNIDEKGTAGYVQTIDYKKALEIPIPEVYYEEQKLVLNKDFICDYSTLPENYTDGDAYDENTVYTYTVNGIGNFNGSFLMELVVVRDANRNLTNADVKLSQYTYEYDGDAMMPEEVRIEYVRAAGTDIPAAYYQCKVQADKVGKGSVQIEPTAEGKEQGYCGRKEIEIVLVADRNIKDAVMGENWQPEITFSQRKLTLEGGVYQSEDKILQYEGEYGREELIQGKDYTVKYGKAEKVGTVNVTFYGIGRYKGSIKKTYKIVPNKELSIQWTKEDMTVEYQKNGAIPEFQLLDEDYVLSKRTDYKIVARNNKKLGMMTLKISGKGNYKGYEHTAELEVVPANISNAAMLVKDKKYSELPGSWKADVVIQDVNGQRLTAGKDYERELIYQYPDMDSQPVPKVGTEITVTAKGINNYAGTDAENPSILEGQYRICQTELKDLIIEIDAKEYTGEEIMLQRNDIHIYADAKTQKAGEEILTDCFEIVGYKRNLRVGLGSVTLQGIGEYGGSGTYYFPIYKKLFETVKVEEVDIEEDEIYMTPGQSKALNVQVYPENADDRTVFWTSSNEEIAVVNKEGVITAKKEGEVTIRVNCRSNGKSDSCKVKVYDVPTEFFFTPQEFREEEDKDDTASFNRAISKLRECGYDTLYVPAGTYQIDALKGIRVRSNINLIMSSDAVLQALGNSSGNYNIIYTSGSSNITISGGKIVGERNKHGSAYGEWGMGIGLYDSENITIKDVTITDCWGDGIYIGTNDDDNPDLGCRNITITNCVMDNNRRNNLSIVSVEGIEVDGCTFSNANGTDPQYGIDIETNNGDNPCEDIIIKNSEFYGNKSGAMGIVTITDDVEISDCIMRGDFINYWGTNVTLSNTRIYGETYARIPFAMKNGSHMEGGSEKEDTLVASFDAAQDDFEIGEYNIDDNNTMLCSYMDSNLSSSGRILRMERTSQGTEESGYYINLSDMMRGAGKKLQAGSTYRFEYVVRGYGQWGIKTDQTPWYPCEPQTDFFATGVTYYKAKDEGQPYRLIFFAYDEMKGMSLEVETVKVYKVN